MSYKKITEYQIVPKNSYEVHRNCGGCGSKSKFQNSGNFRVNANGNKIDVWLIYQCKKCKHTYNLTIYERKDPHTIDKDEYEGFLGNSHKLAEKYGREISLFVENRAEIDKKSQEYELEKISVLEEGKEQDTDKVIYKNARVIIHNKEKVKVRYDKLLSQILDLSRTQIQQFMDNERIICRENVQKNKIEIEISCDL